MVSSSNVQRITSNTTLSTEINVYLIDAGAPATITITLPNINADGINYQLIRTDNNIAGQVTIQGFNPSQTIDGVLSIRLRPNVVFSFESFGIDAGTGGVWHTSNDPFNSNSSFPLALRFDDATGAPFSTSSTTYVTVASFVYRGVTVDNPITSILAIVSTSGGFFIFQPFGQVRVIDFTNASAVIAESAIFPPSSSPTIIDLGIISNLPTSEAIFQIQIRRPYITGNANISAMHVYTDVL